MFQRDVPGPGEWGEVAVLMSSDAADGDRFGASVAIDGDTVVVGAPDDAAGGNESGTGYVVEVVGDEFVTLLTDDFETGDLTRWSQVAP